MVDDVRAVVEGLGLVRPTIVGHSLGGMVAAVRATADPDCPLAVNRGAGGRGWRALVQLLEAIAELDLFDTYRRARCPLLVVPCNHSVHLERPDDFTRLVLDRLRPPPD